MINPQQIERCRDLLAQAEGAHLVDAPTRTAMARLIDLAVRAIGHAPDEIALAWRIANLPPATPIEAQVMLAEAAEALTAIAARTAPEHP